MGTAPVVNYVWTPSKKMFYAGMCCSSHDSMIENFMLHEIIQKKKEDRRKKWETFPLPSSLIDFSPPHSSMSLLPTCLPPKNINVYKHQMNNAMTWCGGKFSSFLFFSLFTFDSVQCWMSIGESSSMYGKILITEQVFFSTFFLLSTVWTTNKLTAATWKCFPLQLFPSIDNFSELSDFCNWKFQHV